MIPLLVLLAPAFANPISVHQPSGNEGVDAITSWLAEHPAGIQTNITSGQLEVYPGSCVETPHYWAIMGGDQKIYVSFGPEVHADFSAESLQKHLRYMNLHFKIQLNESWVAGINNFTPFRTENGGITVEDFSNGRLRLRLEQPAVQLFAINTGSAKCVSEDAHGGMPPGCTAYVSDLQVPTDIQIDLPMPNPGEGCDP